MTPMRRIGRYGRIGWLATTLILAIVLVAFSAASYRRAEAAGSILTRGQAELIESGLRQQFDPWTDVDSAALGAFVEEHPELSVRYIALLDTAGAVIASTGERAEPPVMRPQAAFGGGPGDGAPVMEDVGDRYRLYTGRPIFRGGFVRTVRAPADSAAAAPDSAARRGGADGPQFGRRGGGPVTFAMNVVEFEPVASGLVAGANRSLLLSVLGASILTLAALLFWRTSQRYDEARVHLEEQKRLSALGEMSAVLAHEIRNPLASLKGTAQLLAERLAPETRERSRADRIVHEAVRLETLTTDLLSFARTGPIELQPVDPVELLHGSLADLSTDGFEVDAMRAPELWTLDARRVGQMLTNILDNARQASPEGTSPEVRVFEEKGALVYEVRDRGPGIPTGSEERIFDPFFTTRTTGTGLGLAVARRVAEMHGGGITAKNHPDGGAVFRITLPRSGS